MRELANHFTNFIVVLLLLIAAATKPCNTVRQPHLCVSFQPPWHYVHSELRHSISSRDTNLRALTYSCRSVIIRQWSFDLMSGSTFLYTPNTETLSPQQWNPIYILTSLRALHVRANFLVFIWDPTERLLAIIDVHISDSVITYSVLVSYHHFKWLLVW